MVLLLYLSGLNMMAAIVYLPGFNMMAAILYLSGINMMAAILNKELGYGSRQNQEAKQ